MQNNIAKLRNDLGISRQQLAEKIGVHKNTVINWETGATDMKSTDLVKMAEVFGCGTDEILLPGLEELKAS